MHKAAILGATGFVGQRFIQLLQGHPWFEVKVLAASERSVGKSYADAAHWLMETPRPQAIGDNTIVACTPDAIQKAGDVDVIFHLPNELAGPAETSPAGYPVI